MSDNEVSSLLEQIENYKSKYGSAQKQLAAQSQTIADLANENQELKAELQQHQDQSQAYLTLQQEFAAFKAEMTTLNARNRELMHKEHVLECVTSSASYRLTRKIVETLKRLPFAHHLKTLAHLLKR